MQIEEKIIVVRRMVDDDMPKLEVVGRSLIGFPRPMPWQIEAEAEDKVYRPTMNFVAELDGVVVGFLLGDIRSVWYGNDMGGWIHMVVVHPNYRHLGIGRRLVEAFCEVCERNKINAQVLLRDDDEQLKSFFKFRGFRNKDKVILAKECRAKK
jgi:ribosomal protein S18 acetylase RimI-like enzyme